MDRRCHRPANLLCPGQGPGQGLGARHWTGPTAGPRHPASRPKIKRYLFQMRPHHRTGNLSFGTPSASGTLSIKMRRPLYTVKHGCDISMRTEPTTIHRRRRYRNNTRSNKKCSTRTRTTTLEQLARPDRHACDDTLRELRDCAVFRACVWMVRVRACLCFESAFVCALEVRVRVVCVSAFVWVWL